MFPGSFVPGVKEVRSSNSCMEVERAMAGLQGFRDKVEECDEVVSTNNSCKQWRKTAVSRWSPAACAQGITVA